MDSMPGVIRHIYKYGTHLIVLSDIFVLLRFLGLGDICGGGGLELLKFSFSKHDLSTLLWLDSGCLILGTVLIEEEDFIWMRITDCLCSEII